MIDIVLFGKPGSGKGTQAQLLRDRLGNSISHLSTGDVFRSLTSKPNAIGDYVTERMHAGLLINDDVTISLFTVYFYTIIDSKKAMLLDGYPRTMTQMEACIKLCKEHNRKVIGFNFELDDETTVQRMMGRAREDEDESIMKIRLDQYYIHTQPLTERFAQEFPVHTINAAQDINMIHQEVMNILSSM